MINKIISLSAKFSLIALIFLFCLNVSFTATANGDGPGIVSLAKADSPSVVTQTLLGKDSTGTSAPGGNWVINLYNFSKSFVNIIALIILLFIAFSTMLGQSVDTYGIKKLLPTTIIAIIVANISLPIFAVGSSIIDTIQDQISFFAPYQFVNAFGFFFHNMRGTTTFGTLAVGFTAASILTGGIAGAISVGLAIILILAPVLILIALGFIFSFRPYVLFLAGGLAPIAILLSVLPQTQSLFKKWLNISIAWLVMPIITYGIIHLADMIPVISYVPKAGGAVSALVGYFLPIAIKGGLLLLAIRFPFMIEKDITGLTRIIGKATGNAVMYGGARVGSKIFEKYKRIDQDVMSRVGEKRDKAMRGFDGLSTGKNKDFFIKTMIDNGESEEDAEKVWYKAKTIDDRNQLMSEALGKQFRQQILQEPQYRRRFWNNPDALLNLSGIPSFALAAIEGTKAKKEIASRETSKNAQKALFRGAWQPSSDDNRSVAYMKRILFDPRNIRGALGDMKYFEEIAENDLKGNLSPDQIAFHIQSLALMKRMVDAMVGKDPSMDRADAEKIVEGRMQQLYIAQESVGTWGGRGFIRDAGLNSAEVAKLKVGYGRIQEQALRQSAYGQGQIRREMGYRDAQRAMHGRALEGVDEFRERMVSEGYKAGDIDKNLEKKTDIRSGASGTDQPGNGLQEAERRVADERGLEDDQSPDTAVTQKLDTLIEAISGQTRTMGQGLNINAIRSAVSLVDGAGLRPTDVGSIDGKIDGLIASFSDRTRGAGFREQDIRKFASILESEVFDVSSVTSQLGSAGNDAQIRKILEDIQSAKVAKVGLLSGTEQAQSVQRISDEIVPRILQNANLAQELQKACGQVIEVQLGINPNISPEQLNVARNLIASNVSGFVSTTGEGESTFDVSAQAALRILKAIESSVKG